VDITTAQHQIIQNIVAGLDTDFQPELLQIGAVGAQTSPRSDASQGVAVGSKKSIKKSMKKAAQGISKKPFKRLAKALNAVAEKITERLVVE
jgi:hypothetical protein